ncbi:DUF2214 domain-containing protein [Plastoroseomonas hellenica]|uniref:DUF2214 domain-containing protein n=1 Tax=Plastoroseomonas hellenica TaxID=2687306 RepID=UPI001BA8B957|nr:DUF2214 domain-containing protein [Plastoroseomonas hellenica]
MELLQALSDWPVAAALRRSGIAYPLVNAAHILSIGLLVGAIATLDLRILGMFRASALAELAMPLRRVAACGVASAAVTGFLLFSTRPLTYIENPAFLIKLGLVGLGVLNAILLGCNRHWPPARAGAPIHWSLRLSAAVSLLVWVGAVIAGRWIGFLQ